VGVGSSRWCTLLNWLTHPRLHYARLRCVSEPNGASPAAQNAPRDRPRWRSAALPLSTSTWRERDLATSVINRLSLRYKDDNAAETSTISAAGAGEMEIC